jgi:hypothetical protein
VADDIFFAEKDKLNVLNVLQDLPRFFEPGSSASRKSDLGVLPGDHRF